MAPGASAKRVRYYSKPPAPIGQLNDELSLRGADPVEHDHPQLLNV